MKQVTDVYHNPAERTVPYVPTGEIYVKIKEGAGVATTLELLKKYSLIKTKLYCWRIAGNAC